MTNDILVNNETAHHDNWYKWIDLWWIEKNPSTSREKGYDALRSLEGIVSAIFVGTEKGQGRASHSSYHCHLLDSFLNERMLDDRCSDTRESTMDSFIDKVGHMPVRPTKVSFEYGANLKLFVLERFGTHSVIMHGKN